MRTSYALLLAAIPVFLTLPPLAAQMSFPPSQGVPTGTALPPTCTPGPNTLFFRVTSGPVGSLFQCTTPNTWTGFAASTVNIATACGVSGGPITSTGTVSGSITIDSQAGSTPYAIPSSSCGKLISRNNASAVADTIVQAGTAGIINGWWAYYQCVGAGGCTITPATSTIDGAASLALIQNQGVLLASNGTAYFTMRGVGGSGIVSAVSGTTFGTSSAADQSPITTAAGAASWANLAACKFSGYSTSSHAWTCATIATGDLPDLSGTYVPVTRTVNGFPLSSNITLPIPTITGSSLLKGASGNAIPAIYSDVAVLWGGTGACYLKKDGNCDIPAGGPGGGTPGGVDGDLQINSSGAFAGRHLGTGLLCSLTDCGVDPAVFAKLDESNVFTNLTNFTNAVTVSGLGSGLDISDPQAVSQPWAFAALPATCIANTQRMTNSVDGHDYRCNNLGTGWIDMTGGSAGGAPGSDGNALVNVAGNVGAVATTGTGNIVRAGSPVLTGQPTITDQTNMQATHESAATGGQLTATAIQTSSKQGNGTKFIMAEGAFVAGNGTTTNSNGNLVDTGNPAGSGGGGGGSGVGRQTLIFPFTVTIVDGTCATQTATWPGITTSDFVIADAGQYGLKTWVSAANTVSGRLCPTGGDITPGTLTANALLGTYGLTKTQLLDFPNIPDGTCQTLTISGITGLNVGDPVIVKWPDLSSYPYANPGQAYSAALGVAALKMCALGSDVDLPGTLSYTVQIAK